MLVSSILFPSVASFFLHLSHTRLTIFNHSGWLNKRHNADGSIVGNLQSSILWLLLYRLKVIKLWVFLAFSFLGEVGVFLRASCKRLKALFYIPEFHKISADLADILLWFVSSVLRHPSPIIQKSSPGFNLVFFYPIVNIPWRGFKRVLTILAKPQW